MPTTEKIETGSITESATPAITNTFISEQTETIDKNVGANSNILEVDFLNKRKRQKETSVEIEKEVTGEERVSFGETIIKTEEQSMSYLRAMRPFYLSDILSALTDIQVYAGTPGAAMYIDQLQRAKLQMEDSIYSDSFMEIIRALHDSLVYDNNWTDFTAEEYQKAFSIIEPLSKLYPVSQGEIERAILALEDAGFDTTPYSLIDEE